MLKNRRIQLLLIIVIIQIAAFLIWHFSEYSKLNDPTTKEILVKTIPTDPRDFINSNYLTLNYQFSNSWNFKNRTITKDPKYQRIYAILEEEKGYFVPTYLTYVKPKKLKDKQVVIEGKRGTSGNIEYGIEKYSISSNIDTRNDIVDVVLIVDKNYQAKIKSIYVDGREFKTDNLAAQ